MTVHGWHACRPTTARSSRRGSVFVARRKTGWHRDASNGYGPRLGPGADGDALDKLGAESRQCGQVNGPPSHAHAHQRASNASHTSVTRAVAREGGFPASGLRRYRRRYLFSFFFTHVSLYSTVCQKTSSPTITSMIHVVVVVFCTIELYNCNRFFFLLKYHIDPLPHTPPLAPPLRPHTYASLRQSQ